MKALLHAVAALPAPLAYALAWLLYVLLFYVFRYRRRTVRENLVTAFPDMDEVRLREVERESYRHFCDLSLEILRSLRMDLDEFSERVRFTNPELLAAATDDYEKQAIILLIHQGNWEWMLHSATTALPVPADPVYKPLHSPFWDSLMLEARSRFGAQPMALADVGRAVIRGRKRKRIIVMLADQAGPRLEGYWAQFLNRPASFYRGADKLAQTLKIPVLFAQCRRLGRGRYDVTFHDVSLPPHESDSDLILGRYVAMAEHFIAAQPETYLWTNRRWKKIPPDDAPIATPGADGALEKDKLSSNPG